LWVKGKGKGKGKGPKFDGNCYYCQKPGHRATDCYKKQNDEKGGKAKGKGKSDPFSWFGKGGFGGGKGYGKYSGKSVYGMWGQDSQQWGNANKATNWTLNLEKTQVSAPPGLSQVKVQNKFEVLEEENEQRKSDMKEMQKDYDEFFPKMPMGNYSKRS
jgi:hypothetical protein